MISILMWGVGLLLAAVIVATVLQVDDWSRDLSQNRAETRVDHADPRLRSLVVDWSLDETAERVEQVAGNLRGWQFINRETIDNCEQLTFTRTTGLFRFVDDISVTIVPEKSGSVVNVVSQSRVGKGDLGQNPRNIRELLDAIGE